MPVPDAVELFILNDQIAEITGLQDGIAVPVVYKIAATVTITLKDGDGVGVSAINGLVMTFVIGSNGSYRGNIEDTFNPTIGGDYTITIHADEGGAVLDLTLPCSVKVRRS